MDDSDDADDVPLLLEKYNTQIAVIFQFHSSSKNGEKMSNDMFLKALTDCGLVPDPLPAASANRIFNSSLRGRADQLLDFDGFVECLERCSLMAFAEDPTTKATLSPVQAMVRLFQAVARSRAYQRCDGFGDFLLPEHVPPGLDTRGPNGLLDNVAEEEAEQYEGEEADELDGEGQGSDSAAGGLSANDLSPKSTDALLRDLFAYYCAGAGVGGPSGPSSDAAARRMGAGRFYKMVRECNVMDSRVTQAEVSAVYELAR